ncbi:hypothetical protein EAI_14396, partial [Harpegnathos saltator]
LTASVLEASMKVLGFSVKSKNLKGSHVKALRDAAAAIAAGTSLMAKHVANDKCQDNLDMIEELRVENASLKESLKDVKKELEEKKE